MSYNELAKFINGEKVKSIVKLKFNPAYIHEDIKINGNELQLLDKNNKLIENFKIQELFPPDYSIIQIFESTLPSYISAVSQGFNVSLISIGSSSSEKNKLIQSNNDSSFIYLFCDSLFNIMSKKSQEYKQKNKVKNFRFILKLKALQVLEETCKDLLSKNEDFVKVENNEWEGPTAFPCVKNSFQNINELKDLLSRANSRKTSEVTEFGALIDKCFFLYQVELIQITEIVDTDNPLIISSKVNFFEIPSIDPLAENHEQITHLQGSTLNKSLFSFKNIVNSLSQNKNITFFGTSLGNQLLKESLTGNSYTITFHFLNFGELAISSQNLRLLSNISYLKTYPVLNEGNLLGLLKIFRMESLRAYDLVKTKDNVQLDEMALNHLELEKKLINENKDALQEDFEKQNLAGKISNLREKYNEIIKDNAEIKAELIKSEEEKLQISKALIELQIENTKWLEMFQNEKFDGNNKLVEQEAEILARNTREEQALEVIKELQDKIEKLLEEKKELEIEFITIKKNFIMIKNELLQEKEKNENLGIELINITNENKEYQKELHNFQKDFENKNKDKNSLNSWYTNIKKELDENKEAMLYLKSENERLKNEIIRFQLKDEQLRLEIDNKKNEMEKGYIDLAKEKQNELNQYDEENKLKYLKENENRKFFESQRIELLQEKKKLSRKINEYLDKMNEMKRQIQELVASNSKLNLENNEMRSFYRKKLLDYKNNLKDSKGLKENKNIISYNTREDLIRDYAEREIDLLGKIDHERSENRKIKQEIRSLKIWSRQLKDLAEDYLPHNPPTNVIDILQKNVNSLGDIKPNEAKHYLLENDEIQILNKRNNKLQDEVKRLNNMLIGLDKSNENPTIHKPLFKDMNPFIENIQKENEKLQKENDRLHNSLRENNKHEIILLEKENTKLKRTINELENRNYSTSPLGNNHKILVQKVSYYEKNNKELETERSKLYSRCIMAEEELKNYKELMNKTLKQYQKKINELKKNIN